MADGKAIGDALGQIAKLLTASIQASLAEVKLDNTGLQKSVESKVVGGDTITAYMADYGRYVISGRRPFARKVPISALLKWIAQKGISSSNPRLSSNRLAFAIQNAIYKNGIRGRDFLTPAVGDEFLQVSEELLLKALQKEAESVLG
jgi:hypothetical protein